jgi:hypothetical protein
MYPVRASSLRWGITIAFALVLCALFAAPTLAGGEPWSRQYHPERWAEGGHGGPPRHAGQGRGLVLSHSVTAGSSSFVAFGPVGPNCSATTAGPDCTFVTLSSTASGNAEPGGPFTSTGTATLLIGPFSTGQFVFPNGAVDSNGNPAGGCVQIFGTNHDVYANGTIDSNFQGHACCASSSCADFIGGPPNISQSTSVCVSGTGKYAGIQCSGEQSGSSIDGQHFVGHSESVSTK